MECQGPQSPYSENMTTTTSEPKANACDAIAMTTATVHTNISIYRYIAIMKIERAEILDTEKQEIPGKLQSFCLKKQFNNFQVAGILSSLNTSSHDALLAWTRRQVVDPL